MPSSTIAIATRTRSPRGTLLTWIGTLSVCRGRTTPSPSPTATFSVRLSMFTGTYATPTARRGTGRFTGSRGVITVTST